jgi:nitroreductase/dihydropteridine reductase
MQFSQQFNQLNWQYVITRTNNICPTNEKISCLLDKIRSAGSRLGLLPKTIGVLGRRDQIDRIFPPGCFPQYREFSHLFIFSAYSRIGSENINELIAHIADCNSLCLDNKEDYKEALKLLVKVPDDSQLKWGERQAYTALGIGMTMAMEENMDVLPIEVFNHEIVDKVLDLKTKGLCSVLILAVGKREQDRQVKPVPSKPRQRRQTSFLVN